MKKLWLVAICSLNVYAGQIYQCGSSFQDTPCATDKPGKVVGNYEVVQQTPEEIAAYEEQRKKQQEKIDAEIQARYDAEVEAATKARHEAYKYASFITAVKQHQIMIGMSEEDLKKSWGYPDHINETVTENGKREQWVYISESGRNYVYVENGVITAWN